MNTSELRVTTTEAIGPGLARVRRLAGLGIVLGAALMLVGVLTSGAGVLASYWFAYLFWFGVTLGSLAVLMLHHVVGGAWSFTLRRLVEAGSSLRLFGLMGVLFLIPVVLVLFLNLPALWGAELGHGHFGWAHPAAQEDPVIRQKALWLNPTRFLIFSLAYFAIWMLFSWRLHTLGATQDERADLEISQRLNYWGAAGLVVYALTMTFASVDWIMSLTPHWYSTIFGMLTIASQGLSTLALMLWLMAIVGRDRPLLRRLPGGWFRDLGNLTLAFVLLWAYLSFSQYLVIYTGNLTEDIAWYTQRREGGWGWVGLFLIPFHFFFPFLVLLIASNWKSNPRTLAVIAGCIVLARFIDLFWWVMPTFRPQLAVTPADLGAPLLIGGLWLWLWADYLKDRPVVPLHDPRFLAHVEEVAHG